MPLYSYICTKCNKYFEILIPLKDYDKDILCKYCSKKLKKKITSVMFRVN
jgi:putative FmdB family regulatory protein